MVLEIVAFAPFCAPRDKNAWSAGWWTRLGLTLFHPLFAALAKKPRLANDLPGSAFVPALNQSQKTALCAPCEHPGGFGIRKSASNSGHSPLRGSGDDRCNDRRRDQCNDRPIAALHFLPPTGHENILVTLDTRLCRIVDQDAV